MFPLQSEVGEAIALYLKKARPKCACRNLFVTRHVPYRPVLGHCMFGIINRRVKILGLVKQQFGPHMLRRACATQLLRTGSSIKDIADFLGHKGLQSVSSYAKYDPASLNHVAKFSLRGVL
jgi:integrase